MAKHIVQPRLIELESFLDKYFKQNIAPKLSITIKNVTARRMAQLEKDTSPTFTHSLAGLRTARIGVDDNQLAATSKYFKGFNSEIIKELNKNIKGDKSIQKDLAKISMELRVHLLQQMAKRMGSEDKAISTLKSVNLANGKDIVSAYVSEVMARKAINKIAAKQMPSSSFEYVIKNGFANSIYGSMIFHSDDDVDTSVNENLEKKYHASGITKFTATTYSSITDTAATGGASSVSYLVGIGLDNLTRLGLDKLSHSRKDNIGYVDAASVLGDIYNGSRTSFNYAEEHASSYNPNQSLHLQYLNQQIHKKIKGIKSPPSMPHEDKKSITHPPHHAGPISRTKHEDYGPSISSPSYKSQSSPSLQNQDGNVQKTLDNSEGWKDILSKSVKGLGLDGFEDIHKNIGYVLAMLPDLLMGMFTGSTPNLKLEDNMLPLASIMGGLFVKNPLLKVMMLGLGGAKLLNNTGHVALEQAGISKNIQYKKYVDEPLNSRLSSPALQGNNLVLIVDGVPTVAALSNIVVDAHNKGALPLNTLANNVLKKYDDQQSLVSESYNNSEKESLVVERSRGLK